MNLEKENNLEPTGEFAASVRDFRSAVMHVANRETAGPVTANWLAPARKRRRSIQQRTALAWACAALLCFATLPVATHSHHVAVNPIASAVAAAPSTDSDSALLEQVDTNISESVPSSLAPLDFDSSDTTSTTTTSDSSTNGAKLAHTERTNAQ